MTVPLAVGLKLRAVIEFAMAVGEIPVAIRKLLHSVYKGETSDCSNVSTTMTLPTVISFPKNAQQLTLSHLLLSGDPAAHSFEYLSNSTISENCSDLL